MRNCPLPSKKEGGVTFISVIKENTISISIKHYHDGQNLGTHDKPMRSYFHPHGESHVHCIYNQIESQAGLHKTLKYVLHIVVHLMKLIPKLKNPMT